MMNNLEGRKANLLSQIKNLKREVEKLNIRTPFYNTA